MIDFAGSLEYPRIDCFQNSGTWISETHWDYFSSFLNLFSRRVCLYGRLYKYTHTTSIVKSLLSMFQLTALKNNNFYILIYECSQVKFKFVTGCV